jgi:hypothetical protein
MTSRDLSAFPACGIVQQKGLLLMLLAFLAGSRYCVSELVSPTIRPLRKHNVTGKCAYVPAAEWTRTIHARTK